MRLGVSPKILKIVKESLREGKIVPLIKYRVDGLRVGDIISLKSTPTSIKVRVVDIKEYFIENGDVSSIPDDVKIIYDDNKLKAMFGDKRTAKVYVVYVAPIKPVSK